MTDQPAEQMEVRFFYEKGHAFRVIHVDGAYGGLAPSGKYIAMSLYNERRPIPREQTFDVTQDGRLVAPAKSTLAKEGLFREVEICAIMDVGVARAMHAWLGEWIEKAERAVKRDASGQ